MVKKALRNTVVLLGLMAPACVSTDPTLDTASDTADTISDTGQSTDEPSPGVMLGQIEVVISGWGGVWDTAAQVRADFYDSPMRMEAFAPFPPGRHEIAFEEGGCILWLPAQGGQCSPPCDWDEYCGEESSCLTMPQRVSAGDITVGGTGSSIVIHPSEWGYDGGNLATGDLGAEATVSAVAQGADLPAFDLETQGLAAPQFEIDESNALVLVDGQDNVIEFTAGDTGVVRLVLNKGWHGALPEATLMCEVSPQAGQLVIPAAAVEAFPVAGGPGLEQHLSFIELLHRDRASLAAGPVELVVAYRRYLYPSHGR
ncbi:MAG: hypothetical protein MUC50_11395 [Myxococcota bacterium]|jgi:hypothetical protein|nr:hypothetical protein [Myxococcota bacterium]